MMQRPEDLGLLTYNTAYQLSLFWSNQQLTDGFLNDFAYYQKSCFDKAA